MDIEGKIAIITGAASGIGRAAAIELQKHKIAAIALVDLSDGIVTLAKELNRMRGNTIAVPFQGDATDHDFRKPSGC